MRKQFSKKDIKEFIETHTFAQDLMTKKSNVYSQESLLYIEGTLSCIQLDGVWVPSLHLLQKNPSLLPTVTVDKGAIKFVINGADIMRPGVVSAQEFDQGDFVTIIDETVGKPIAVCKSLYSSSDLLEKSSGKVLEMKHHFNDDYWNAV